MYVSGTASRIIYPFGIIRYTIKVNIPFLYLDWYKCHEIFSNDFGCFFWKKNICVSKYRNLIKTWLGAHKEWNYFIRTKCFYGCTKKKLVKQHDVVNKLLKTGVKLNLCKDF